MAEYTNASRDRRPDAVSSDYLTAFAFGPIQLSDTSEGLIALPWRGRYVDGWFKLSRSGGDSWEAETAIFEISGAAPTELDFCFAQNGEPVVTLERDESIWLYWFDPTLGTNTLSLLGSGRTPRIILDDPVEVADSDVQLFYVDDLFDTVRRRQQRDRYEIEYDVPITDVEHVYLEDVFRTINARIAILYSIRDTVAGRYGLHQLVSTLFPIRIREDFESSNEAVSGELRTLIHVFTLETEELETSNSAASGALDSVFSEIFIEGEFEGGVVVNSLVLRDLIIQYDMEVEEFETSNSATSGILRLVIIIPNMETEEFETSNSAASGTLVVA